MTPEERAQRARDREDLLRTQRANRQAAYDRKVRNEAIDNTIDQGGTTEDVELVNEFFGLLGMKHNKVENVKGGSKRKVKNTINSLKSIEKNKRISPRDRAKARRVRKELED